jgi:hypothetical protein
VTVNVSSISLSNASPVSPGANETSKFCAIIESDVRKLISARFLPGQPYAPVQLSAVGLRWCHVAGIPRENGRYVVRSVPISFFLSPNRSGMKSLGCCHHRPSRWMR